MSLRSNVKKDLLPGDRPHGLCINPFLPLLSTITVYENYYAGSIAHTVKNFSLVSDILWATMSFLPTRHAVLHSLHTVCWRLPLDQRLWTVFENSFFCIFFFKIACLQSWCEFYLHLSNLNLKEIFLVYFVSTYDLNTVIMKGWTDWVASVTDTF